MQQNTKQEADPAEAFLAKVTEVIAPLVQDLETRLGEVKEAQEKANERLNETHREVVNCKELLQNKEVKAPLTNTALFEIMADKWCQKMAAKLDSLPKKNSFRILIGLLEILQRLATCNDYILLDQNQIIAERTIAEQERINPVFAYLVENFRNHVSLQAAAGIANMTPNAFCKYFKKITRKTFMETIIEYRLNYAIQQLVQTDKPISDISFESGFGDVSHFYKMFKLKMHLSPLNYRKKFVRSFDEEDIKIVA